MVDDIDKSESAVVVNIVGGAWSNHSVSPDERCTQIVIVLLEIDQTVIVAVKIAIQLICATASVTSTAELEGASVLQCMKGPVVG